MVIQSTLFLFVAVPLLGLAGLGVHLFVQSYREVQARMRILKAKAKEAEERAINEQLNHQE